MELEAKLAEVKSRGKKNTKLEARLQQAKMDRDEHVKEQADQADLLQACNANIAELDSAILDNKHRNGRNNRRIAKSQKKLRAWLDLTDSEPSSSEESEEESSDEDYSEEESDQEDSESEAASV